MESKFSFVVLYGSSVFRIGLRNRTVLLSHTHSSYSGCIKEMFPVLQKKESGIGICTICVITFFAFLKTFDCDMVVSKAPSQNYITHQ